MNKKAFTIGADPEFVILKDGKNFSAEGVIGHGKFNPLDMGNGIAAQEDNILVEFNIEPATNKIDFLRSNLKALYSIWHTFLKDKGLTISKECYAEFDEESLNTEQAQAVGCSPEFDAYTCSMIDPPQLDKTSARTAGGHIHIGYEGENLFDSMSIIKMLDLYLAVPSLILDKDKKRRAIYGKPSSYRRNEGIKVEYRTLSNFWLFDKILIEWVYDVVEKVVNDVLNGTIIDDELYMRVRHTINNNDEDEARKIIAEQSDIIMPTGTSLDLLEQVYNPTKYTEEFIADNISEDIDVVKEEEISQFERNTAEEQKRMRSKDGGYGAAKGGWKPGRENHIIGTSGPVSEDEIVQFGEPSRKIQFKINESLPDWGVASDKNIPPSFKKVIDQRKLDLMKAVQDQVNTMTTGTVIYNPETGQVEAVDPSSSEHVVANHKPLSDYLYPSDSVESNEEMDEEIMNEEGDETYPEDDIWFDDLPDINIDNLESGEIPEEVKG